MRTNFVDTFSDQARRLNIEMMENVSPERIREALPDNYFDELNQKLKNSKQDYERVMDFGNKRFMQFLFRRG